jgi:hypothetical protein
MNFGFFQADFSSQASFNWSDNCQGQHSCAILVKTACLHEALFDGKEAALARHVFCMLGLQSVERQKTTNL